MLARLAHFVARHRYVVIAVWVVLTLFGGFAAGQVSKRWYQSFSIPGKSAYEANQGPSRRSASAYGRPTSSSSTPAEMRQEQRR